MKNIPNNLIKIENKIYMRNDLFHLFSNEKASLGILSADRNFVRIISESIPRVNMCREELKCQI